ncbi:MAG TPA: protein kinase [Polyangiales bacterium]|nr:protein kinase [Polyangiales bacterium]
MAEASVPLEEAGHLIAGRYLIEEVLGRGGMATVYRVQDNATGARCALKRVRASGPGSAERRQQLLEREYYTLAQLAHPRIIAVYDFGRDERGPYYTMELLDGADLASLGRVPWQQACALLRDVASSLSVLHSRGLLHRDVSARNVRYGSGGSAKLIDFGALCSIGLDLEVVGTPPFVAPEAMQLQALDARVDLFSLGALGYFLLGGRHAYPARHLRDLRDVWRSAPPPIGRLVPEVPAALNELIMDLLSLDRAARPQHAAEVMKRLCTIAQLPIDEDSGVSRAYLTAPALVGREQALVTTRKALLSLVRGDGQTLLIEGAPGLGRSRMLDAAVLEGKLLGALVLRAHVGDRAAGDWAAARSLVAQLMSWSVDRVDTALRLSRDVLSHVIDGFGAPVGPFPDRSLLIRELRDFVLALAEGQRLLIAVDDAHRIDEPSLALLAALAHKTERHPLVLALTTEPQEAASSSASLRLLQSLATRIELVPFTATQTEALLRSVFGDVPNLAPLAAHIQRQAQGNPRATMELAEYLVEGGVCRYEDGSWSLPSSLSDRDLPSSLAQTLETRLLALSGDALALCEAASIAELPALSVPQFAELCGGWPPERVFVALHELVRARVLMAEGAYYRFSQRGYVPVVRVLTPDERRKALHSRMADLLLAQGADVLLLVHHLLEADRDEQAITALQTIDSRTRHPPSSLYERALAHAERRHQPQRVLTELRVNLMTACSFALDIEGFRRVAPRVLEVLVADSGLALYQQLSDLPAPERLSQALMRTQQKYLETPEHERVYPVDEAIRKLARLANGFAIVGLFAGELKLVRSFPDLEPLLPLSAAIGVMRGLLLGATHWLCGRFRHSSATYEEILARIEQPDRGGLEPEQQELVNAVCQTLLGSLEAPIGNANCEQRALRLETHRAFRGSAWRIRQLFHLSRGDMEQARKCMRRAELLTLQEGIEQQVAGGAQGTALLTYVRSEDLIALDSAVADVASLAERMPYWRPMQLFGESARLRLRGDPRAALEVLLPALELAAPGLHWMFGTIAASHIRLLSELDRLDEAIARGQEYLRVAEREGLNSANEVRAPLAWALARAGRPQEGLVMVQELLELLERARYSGIVVGTAFETGARISLMLGDRAGFDDHAQRCAAAWQVGNNRILNAKLARLLAEADPSAAARAAETVDEATLGGEYETIHSRINECVDKSDRARCALTLLLQQAERFSGYLFAATSEHELSLLAALPEEPSPEIERWANAWYRMEISAHSGNVETAEAGKAPDTAPPDAVSGLSPHHRDRDGHRFEALLLTVPRERTLVAVGVLVLELHQVRARANKGLMTQIASLMLAHGDASAVGILDRSMFATREQ